MYSFIVVSTFVFYSYAAAFRFADYDAKYDGLVEIFKAMVRNKKIMDLFFLPWYIPLIIVCGIVLFIYDNFSNDDV
jgi:hypothetical protein